VLIPDFGFQKDGLKAYMEVVGFWTREYLERKLAKLRKLQDVSIIVAVDKSLACSELKAVKGEVILYRKDVPLKPVADYLRALEERSVGAQVERLRATPIPVKGDALEIADAARGLGVSEEALKRVLAERGVKGYRLLGKMLVSEAKLALVKSRLEELGDRSLSEALRLIEEEGLKDTAQVLEALGYRVRWRGLDPAKATFYGEEGTT